MFALHAVHDNTQPTCSLDTAATLIAPELKCRRATFQMNEVRDLGSHPRRYARKISSGNGLSQLVVPNGGRYWRYNYRHHGKTKTLAYGVFPDVSFQTARTRHLKARRLLAQGIDPSTRKQEIVSASVVE
jgi:hypothetical protein